MENKAVQEKETKKKEKLRIADFKLISDNSGKVTSINVIVSNGDVFPVAYTRKILERLREDMLQYAKYEQKEILPKKKKFNTGYKVLTVAGAAGFVILNTSEFGKQIAQDVPATTGLVLCATGIVGSLVNYRSIARINRNATFAYHKDEINEAISKNPYIYENVSLEDKKKIVEWLSENPNEPIVIEKIRQLNPSTITTIWKNIKLNKYFGIEYEVESRDFQKTIEQV